MTYSDFTLDTVMQTFAMSIAQQHLFANATPVPASSWLQETLQKGMQLALMSEKARSEFIVAPVLLSAREMANNVFSIYSGQRFDIAPDKGLSGECDFILAHTPPLPLLQAPIVAVVEAKKQDIEAGLGQCAAQMIGVRLFNEQRNTAPKPIYGCVTTGEAWHFLHLQHNAIIIDQDRYYIVNIDAILGVFQAIVAQL